jgi:hypothetical protein
LLLFIAWSGLLIPLFVAWVSDADISHITDFAMDATVLLVVFMLMRRERELPSVEWRSFVSAGTLCLALMMVSGVVLLGVQLTAAQDTVLSEHFDDAEAQLLRRAWGRLPSSAKVLGYAGTGSILTGQLIGGIYALPPGSERQVWEAMLTSPRVETLVRNGFDFVFVQSRWWNGLDSKSQQELEDPCVTVFARGEDFPGGRFAEILDLRACP